MVIRNRRAWEPQGDNGVCVCVCVQGLRAYLKEWLFVYVPGCKSVCMCVPMHGGGILACLPRVNHRRVRDTLALARWSWAAVGPAGVREAAAAGLALACSETSDALARTLARLKEDRPARTRLYSRNQTDTNTQSTRYGRDGHKKTCRLIRWP